MCAIVRVILIVGVFGVFVVTSNGLKFGEPGVCKDVSVEEVIHFEAVRLRRPCPKNMTKCNKSDAKKFHFNPKTHYCCSEKTGEKEPITKPICCKNWKYVRSEKMCQPECKFGCQNGRCVAPDTCQCPSPLALHNYKCIPPVCDPPCGFHAHCDNDSCKCDDDFIFLNSTHCVTQCETGYVNDPVTFDCIPKCDVPCINATCTAPNTCSCIDGYKKKNDYSCMPDCTPSCVKSECVEPNFCSCFEGYRRENSTTCSPICDACLNGDCKAPNVCVCHPGFDMEEGTCRPVCDKKCNNGKCSEPNVCTCDLGFEMDPKNKFNCFPTCKPKCVNASCDSPNTCSCYKGYEKAGNDFTCKPRCDDCDNGECIAPNVCRCSNGYSKKDDGKCTPDCDRPCLNGVCSGLNECSCHKNYQVDYSDKYSCLPICEKKCVNATCVAPNNCKCLDGYIPTMDDSVCKPKCKACDNGICLAPNKCQCLEGYTILDDTICSPVCHHSCRNGICVAPDTCVCKGEYLKNETDPSICFKPCKGLCANGVCSIDGECKCNKKYELINDTCIPVVMVECKNCAANCTVGECWCDNGRPCTYEVEALAEPGQTASLAGLEVTWTLCGAISLLLVVLMMVVMNRIWKRRKQMEAETPERNAFGSVVYTVPDGLMKRNMQEHFDGAITEELDQEAIAPDEEIAKETSERLLTSEANDNM